MAKLSRNNLVQYLDLCFITCKVIDKLAAIIITADIDAHGIAQLLKKPLNNRIIRASKHTAFHKPMPLIGCHK